MITKRRKLKLKHGSKTSEEYKFIKQIESRLISSNYLRKPSSFSSSFISKIQREQDDENALLSKRRKVRFSDANGSSSNNNKGDDNSSRSTAETPRYLKGTQLSRMVTPENKRRRRINDGGNNKTLDHSKHPDDEDDEESSRIDDDDELIDDHDLTVDEALVLHPKELIYGDRLKLAQKLFFETFKEKKKLFKDSRSRKWQTHSQTIDSGVELERCVLFNSSVMQTIWMESSTNGVVYNAITDLTSNLTIKGLDISMKGKRTEFDILSLYDEKDRATITEFTKKFVKYIMVFGFCVYTKVYVPGTNIPIPRIVDHDQWILSFGTKEDGLREYRVLRRYKKKGRGNNSDQYGSIGLFNDFNNNNGGVLHGVGLEETFSRHIDADFVNNKVNDKENIWKDVELCMVHEPVNSSISESPFFGVSKEIMRHQNLLDSIANVIHSQANPTYVTVSGPPKSIASSSIPTNRADDLGLPNGLPTFAEHTLLGVPLEPDDIGPEYTGYETNEQIRSEFFDSYHDFEYRSGSGYRTRMNEEQKKARAVTREALGRVFNLPAGQKIETVPRHQLDSNTPAYLETLHHTINSAFGGSKANIIGGSKKFASNAGVEIHNEVQHAEAIKTIMTQKLSEIFTVIFSEVIRKMSADEFDRIIEQVHKDKSLTIDKKTGTTKEAKKKKQLSKNDDDGDERMIDEKSTTKKKKRPNKDDETKTTFQKREYKNSKNNNKINEKSVEKDKKTKKQKSPPDAEKDDAEKKKESKEKDDDKEKSKENDSGGDANKENPKKKDQEGSSDKNSESKSSQKSSSNDDDKEKEKKNDDDDDDDGDNNKDSDATQKNKSSSSPQSQSPLSSKSKPTPQDVKSMNSDLVTVNDDINTSQDNHLKDTVTTAGTNGNNSSSSSKNSSNNNNKTMVDIFPFEEEEDEANQYMRTTLIMNRLGFDLEDQQISLSCLFKINCFANQPTLKGLYDMKIINHRSLQDLSLAYQGISPAYRWKPEDDLKDPFSVHYMGLNRVVTGDPNGDAVAFDDPPPSKRRRIDPTMMATRDRPPDTSANGGNESSKGRIPFTSADNPANHVQL